MWIQRAIERRRSLRSDAATLVKHHGRRAAEIAFNRSYDYAGRDAAAQRYWQDVARFVRRWEVQLSILDIRTRDKVLDRYAGRS